MCLLDGLDNLLEQEPTRLQSYNANFETSTRISNSLPLVHLACKVGHLIDILLNPPKKLIPTNPVTSAGSRTQELEQKGGLTPSLYFFAGRAHTGDGNVALSFAPKCEVAHTGIVAPFDTGGMIAGKI